MRRQEQGSSLAEVLIAAALVGTAVIAAAASVLESSEHQRANARIRAVTPVIASLLDEARGTPVTDLTTVLDGQTRTLTGIPDVRSASATFTVTDVPTGSARWLVKNVRVRVQWDGKSGPVEISGSTYVADWSVMTVPASSTPGGGTTGSPTATAGDGGTPTAGTDPAAGTSPTDVVIAATSPLGDTTLGTGTSTGTTPTASTAGITTSPGSVAASAHGNSAGAPGQSR